MCLLKDSLAPMTSEIGFLYLDADSVSKRLLEWQSGLTVNTKRGISLKRRKIKGALNELLPCLLPLTNGEHRRYLFIPVGNGWTAYFDNGVNGSDPASVVSYLAEDLKCKGLRVACVPDTITSDGPDARGRYGAVILEEYTWGTGDILNIGRSICCINDGGRWSFDQSGVPFPFEDLSAYEKRRIKDRFTPEMLEQYVENIGIRCFDETIYTCDASKPAYLVEKIGAHYRDTKEYTLEEAQSRF